MKVLIHVQTSTVAPLKFGIGSVISYHIYQACDYLWRNLIKTMLINVATRRPFNCHSKNYSFWLCDCPPPGLFLLLNLFCPACRTSLIATRFWVVVICPIIKCLTVLEFSFILFDLCLFITIFNFILNYVPIVTSWIFTYHIIWILLIICCFIWNYWIIYFLTCLEVFWSVVS